MTTCPNNVWNHTDGCTCVANGSVLTETDVDLSERTSFPSAPLTDGDRVVLADYRGAFVDGYTPSDVYYLCQYLESAQLGCLWEYRDDWGFGGDSEFFGVARNDQGEPSGPYRPIHPDVWEYLTDPDSPIEPADLSSLLDDAVFERGDPSELEAEGRNFAIEVEEACVADDGPQ